MNFVKRSIYYNQFRKADYRLTNKIIELLDLNKNSTIADIGAGTGNYSTELIKHNLSVYAVEPSKEMIAQSCNQQIKWINSYVENINLPNNSVDGTIIVNALHHFTDVEKGLTEIKRITNQGPILIFTFDPKVCKKIWLYDYWPQLTKYLDDNYLNIDCLKSMLDCIFNSKVEEYVFEIPYDFTDIFSAATWRRPELLLNNNARQAMSVFNYLHSDIVNEGLQKLKDDLVSGTWQKKYSDLISCDTYDVGCRFFRVKI